jgi:hypothetical protein
LAIRLCDEFLSYRRWGDVLEPSSGDGAFCRAIRRYATFLDGIDLEPKDGAKRACDGHNQGDFLTLQSVSGYDLILGNPPFSGAEAHVRHALSLLNPGGCLAFLLRLAFTESAARVGFWREFPASKIVVLAERPSFTGGGTDNAAYGFFIWEKTRIPGRATEIVPGWSWRGGEQAKDMRHCATERRSTSGAGAK